MNEDKYVLSDSWARGKDYKTPFDYVVEHSKQTLLIRRLDMGDLLKLGIAEQMDFMSRQLMSEDKAAEQTEQSAKDAVSSAIMKSDNFAQMEFMVNAVCLAGILKPKVLPVPEHDSARQKGMFYIDYIPFQERMELFSVIYDAEGLSDFREEQTDGVGNLADVPSVQLPADESVDVRPDNTEGVLLQSGSVPVREDGRIGNEQSGESVESEPSSGVVNGSSGEHSTVGSSEPVSGN